MGLVQFGLPLVMIIIGPLFIFNCLKSMRSGEGMYDSESTGHMAIANIGGVLLGIAVTGWAVWQLWRVAMALMR